MSGGHFCDCGYDYYKVSQFADELEQEILNNGKVGEPGDWYPNHEPEVIEYLKEQLPKMRKMAEIMRHVDYLYSGDHGDDTFMKRVEEVENKYNDHIVWQETGLGLIFEVSIEKALGQVSTISTLQEGWADGLGRKISEMAVTTANDIVRKTPGLASLYRIYPREDGGILFDFEINGWDLSIEVSESGSLEFYGISIEGDESMSPVAFPAVTEELLKNLAQISRATNV